MKPILPMLLPAVVLASGCASVVNGSTHPMKIDTRTPQGQLVAGADCTLVNGKAVSNAKSGETTNVRRAADDLDVTCKHPSNPDAVGRVKSRVTGSMFGNIIAGGVVGAVVDHARGVAYAYPTWIQLVFGQTLAFDRRDEKDGAPTPPVPASAPAAAAAASPRGASAPVVAAKPS